MLTMCFLNNKSGIIAEDTDDIDSESFEGNIDIIGSTVHRFHSVNYEACVVLSIE